MSNELEACGHDIEESTTNCPPCAIRNKKPFFMKWWFWTIAVIFICIIGGTVRELENLNYKDIDTMAEKTEATTETVSSVFDGNCGIAASAKIESNTINMFQSDITITNTAGKEITAIRFYVVLYNVSGGEITGASDQRTLSVSTPIPADETTTISYQPIENGVRNMKLYVYSVCFADGTQWGDKDAATSEILSDAPTIEVKIKS